MGRLVLLVIVVALIAFAIYQLFQFLVQRMRQKELARYAPGLLRHNNVPGPVADFVIEQGRQLDEVERLLVALDEDPAVLVPSEYADPLQAWVRERRQQRRRLSQ